MSWLSETRSDTLHIYTVQESTEEQKPVEYIMRMSIDLKVMQAKMLTSCHIAWDKANRRIDHARQSYLPTNVKLVASPWYRSLFIGSKDREKTSFIWQVCCYNNNMSWHRREMLCWVNRGICNLNTHFFQHK